MAIDHRVAIYRQRSRENCTLSTATGRFAVPPAGETHPVGRLSLLSCLFTFCRRDSLSKAFVVESQKIYILFDCLTRTSHDIFKKTTDMDLENTDKTDGDMNDVQASGGTTPCDGSSDTQSVSLLQLPKEDILFDHIFTLLEVRDLSRLSRVSHALADFVDEYFASAHRLDWSIAWRTISESVLRSRMGKSCSLRWLDVSDCRDCLGNATLGHIASMNSKLRVLRANRCTQLTDAALISLAQHCPSLQELWVDGCRGIGDRGLCAIAKNCPGLLALVVDGNWSVTDIGVSMVADMCHALRMLSVSYCYSVTDRAIEKISVQCSGLQQLHVRGCWRVTNRSIQSVGRYCKDMRRLSVAECRDINEISLATLRLRITVDVPPPKHHLVVPWKREKFHLQV